MKDELVRGIVISNICVKLYRNWIINEVARAGERTNERTYVRTYSHTYVRDRPYIPSTTLLCEGIKNEVTISPAALSTNIFTRPLIQAFSDVEKPFLFSYLAVLTWRLQTPNQKIKKKLFNVSRGCLIDMKRHVQLHFS